MKSAASTSRLPPAPSMLNLIGVLHYLIRSFPLHYPLRDLAKTCGPLMHIKVGQVSAIVVSSAHHAEQVLKNHDLACADRPTTMASEALSYNSTNILFSPYGEYWRQMRNVCISELLSPKNIRSSESIRKDEASALIKSISGSVPLPFDLTEKISLFIYSATSRALCSRNIIPTDNGVEMIKAMKEALRLAAQVHPADFFPWTKPVFNLVSWQKFKIMRLLMKAEKVIDNTIEEHKKGTRNSNGDLVDALLRLQETSTGLSITHDNIRAVLIDMIVAGTETSSSLVDWAMAELMKNPRVMAKVQDEIRKAFDGRKTITESDIKTLKYLKLVIKETLRLHPPVSVIPRACREAFEIDGYHIPLNAHIFVNIWSIGRDPKYWSNPESFAPERFEEKPYGKPFEYIPFGSGKRICPGMALGLANAEFLLAQLLYNFDWKLPHGVGPNDIDMTEIEGIAASRKTGLYLIATPSPHAPL